MAPKKIGFDFWVSRGGYFWVPKGQLLLPFGFGEDPLQFLDSYDS